MGYAPILMEICLIVGVTFIILGSLPKPRNRLNKPDKACKRNNVESVP